MLGIITGVNTLSKTIKSKNHKGLKTQETNQLKIEEENRECFTFINKSKDWQLTETLTNSLISNHLPKTKGFQHKEVPKW